MQLKPGMDAEYATYVENNSKDGYSKATVDYSEAWAALMEGEIARGKSLAEVAKETSHTADTEGITGFMYGCAVQGLAHFWIHGPELLKWHNRQYIKDEAKADAASAEGKSVNPAIITIEV